MMKSQQKPTQTARPSASRERDETLRDTLRELDRQSEQRKERLRSLNREASEVNKKVNYVKRILAGLEPLKPKEGNEILRYKDDGGDVGVYKLSRPDNARENKEFAEKQKAAALRFSRLDNVPRERISLAEGRRMAEAFKQENEVALGQMQAIINDLEMSLEGIAGKRQQTSQALIFASGALKSVDDDVIKIIRDFSNIYQSNKGAAAINALSRGGSVDKRLGDSVIKEYQRTIDENIFSGGNDSLKKEILFHCKYLNNLVSEAARAWYAPDSGDVVSYRGQGMTPEGLEQLNQDFKARRATYKVGQFFSTSTDKNIAEDFAGRSHDDVKVVFVIRGHSGRSLRVAGGLSLKDKEHEYLYSPEARFNVTDIKKRGEGGYLIALDETESAANRLLPY